MRPMHRPVSRDKFAQHRDTYVYTYIYIYLAESWILHRWSRSGVVLNSYRIRLSPLERFSIRCRGNLIIINLIIGVDISGQANYEIKWRQITYYIDLVREVIDSYAINYIGTQDCCSCEFSTRLFSTMIMRDI